MSNFSAVRMKGNASYLDRLLLQRADETADMIGYEFVDADGAVTGITYGTLCERAIAMAARITRHQNATRKPALLLFAPGIDYIVAIYACLIAGVPAVPAYPPEPWRTDAGLARLRRIFHDLGPATVLADDMIGAELDTLGVAELRSALLPEGTIDDAHDELPKSDGTAPALLQYTSGSTSEPRGVIVRHENLEHNMLAIANYFRLGRGSRAFVWLPPYHDMGLIGGILTPLFVGFPVRLMSPFDFLKQPLAWLKQVSDFRATVSGGPNFAYDLCVRRHATEQDLAGLDLSSWELAFNGAEPVRQRTMEDFGERFAPVGFDRSAFFPCYGLAEATLIVSGGYWHGEPADDAGRVSCGEPLSDQELIVVDESARRSVPSGIEGEICLSGPSVTDGYWGGEADELFTHIGGRRFVRTGDLGYIRNGELIVTGRTKAVLVQNGVNYHATDIEQAAVTGIPDLRPVAAAFMVEEEHDAKVVIITEARPEARTADAIAAEVRERVIAATGLVPTTVVVGPPGTVERTSSGKVRRGHCRQRFLAGEYAELPILDGMPSASEAGTSPPDTLVALVAGVFAGACGVRSCRRDQSLYELGADSVRAAEVAGVLESALGLEVPVGVVLKELTPLAVAAALVTHWRGQGVDRADVRSRLDSALTRTELTETVAG